MNRVVVLLALASLVALAPAGAQSIGMDPAPGTYHHAVVLSLSPAQPTQELYYRVAIDGTQQTQSPPVLYSTPLFLTALPGKQRTYRITIEIRQGPRITQTDQSVWVIDRSPPPSQAPHASAVQPAVGGQAAQNSGPSPTSIPILSPVSGSFGNEQLLYINEAGFSWVRYTLDGSDPTKGGAPYTHAFVIPRRGSVDLKVAALGRGASQPLTAEVAYTVEQAAAGPISEGSGVRAAPFVIKPPKAKRYYYTLREQRPDASDIRFDHPLELGAPVGSLEYTVLRIRAIASGGATEPDFRYFYAVDRRPAPAPTIDLIGGKIATPRTQIRIDDAPYAKIYYTTNGNTPTPSASLYSKPFALQLSPETAGTITVRALAVAPNGTESRVVTSEFPFTTKTPQPPQVTFAKTTGAVMGAQRRLLVEVPKDDFAVYERTLDGSAPANPTVHSPRATRDMLLSVPRGASVLFSLKFATVDPTGAISAPTKTFQIRVNESPPVAPKISFSDGKLTITGVGTLRYTMTHTGAPPENPGPDARVYSGPVPLAGSAGARVEYYVAAVTTDANGMRSAVSHGGPFVVDRRTPAAPVFWGVSAGGIYNDARTLYVETPPAGTVHYTLSTDGHSPDDPTAQSPVFGANMQFSVPKGSSRAYVVKLREAIGGRIGPVVTIPFTIDRIPPVVPPLGGFNPTDVFNHPVTIEPPKMAAGESVYISLSTKSEPGDPLGSAGRPFETPILLAAESGQELTYRIRLAARDRAGNSAVGSTVYEVTIDRRLPPAPEIQATPAGGTVSGGVTVTIAGKGSDTYHYELTDDGSDPPVPTAQSPQYTSPLDLKPVDGRSTLYTIFAAAQDAAGNLSSTPSVYRVLVTPAESTPPATASSSTPGTTPSGTGTAAAASRSTTPGGEGAVSAHPKEIVSGAKQGGLYNSAVILTKAASEGVVRYEVDSNGGTPPAVTRFSPSLPKELVLEPAPGGTRHYAVRAALFASATSNVPATTELISFTIDRTPPPPPGISGIVDNARYQQPETFSLQAAGGTIYYSLDKLTPFVSSGSLSSTKYMEYTKPVTIGEGEASARYRIHAYTVDAAGNRSVSSPEWTVYFDRGVVYVSPDGSDANDGTSVEPVKTLGRALELAQNRQRGTIFLASGSYTLAHAYRITSGISILGDFNPKDWHQSAVPGKPSTSVTAASPTGAPVFSIEGGGLSVENVALGDGQGGALIDLKKGALSVSNSNLVSSDGVKAIVEATGGTLSFDRVSFNNRGGGPDISADGGALVNANGSTFEAGDTTGDSVLVSIAGASSASVSGSTFRPTAGLRTFAIRAVGAHLKLDGTRIDSGTATRQAVAVYASRSTAELTNTTIAASTDSHMTFGIQAQASTITIDQSNMTVDGSVGATGVWADASHVKILRSRLRGGDTSEFLYLVKLTNSTAEISSSIFEGAATGDYLGIGMTRTGARIVGNTIYGGEGSDRSAAVVLESSPEVALVDNILARLPQAVGQAVSIRSGSSVPEIVANDFAGYSVLVGGEGVPPLTSIKALNSASAGSTGGPIFGNLTEPTSDTFVGNGDLHLKSGSACIGKGVNPASYGGLSSDFDAIPRAAPYDIGALRHR